MPLRRVGMGKCNNKNPNQPIRAERRVHGIQNRILQMNAKSSFFAGQWEEGERKRGREGGWALPLPRVQQWFSCISVSASSQWPPYSELQPALAPRISKSPVFSFHILRYYVIHFSLIVYYPSPDNRINYKMTGIFGSALFMDMNWDLNIVAPQKYMLNELLGLLLPPPLSLVIASNGHRVLELEASRDHL